MHLRRSKLAEMAASRARPKPRPGCRYRRRAGRSPAAAPRRTRSARCSAGRRRASTRTMPAGAAEHADRAPDRAVDRTRHDRVECRTGDALVLGRIDAAGWARPRHRACRCRWCRAMNGVQPCAASAAFRHRRSREDLSNFLVSSQPITGPPPLVHSVSSLHRSRIADAASAKQVSMKVYFIVLRIEHRELALALLEREEPWPIRAAEPLLADRPDCPGRAPPTRQPQPALRVEHRSCGC